MDFCHNLMPPNQKPAVSKEPTLGFQKFQRERILIQQNKNSRADEKQGDLL
jgi:hypothetical protein